jgi:competence protein ComEC
MRADSHIRLFSHNPLFELAASLSFGILFATVLQIHITYLFVALIIATLATLTSAYTASLRIGGLALLTAVFFAGACLTSLQTRTAPNELKNLLAQGLIRPNESVELRGTVVGPVELARDGIHLSVNVETLTTATTTRNCSGTVAVNGYFKNTVDEKKYRELRLQSGSRVKMVTTLDRSERYRNPGVSTLAEYLDTKDIDVLAVLGGPESIVVGNSRPTIAAVVYEWRGLLQREIDARFSNETAAVLAAALLGNRYNLSSTTAERFREGGTFHILVISGAHISFLGALVLLVARRLTKRRWVQLSASASVVWLYTVAVGADISVVRAALMFSFVAGAHLLFRIASPLNSLGAAALGLLVWSPKDLFDPSLQLTFLSVLAIVGLAWPVIKTFAEIGSWRPSGRTPYPPQCARWIKAFSEVLHWSERKFQREQIKLNHGYRLLKTPAADWLERHHLQRLLQYLWAAIVISASVQLLLLPLQIVYFHRLSVSSLILNLVVGILLAILSAVALVAILIAQVSGGIAAPLFVLANGIDWLMRHSVDPFTRLGIASIRIPEYSGASRLIYFLYYVPLVLFVVLMARWKPVGSGRSRRGRSSGLEQGITRGGSSRQEQGIRRGRSSGLEQGTRKGRRSRQGQFLRTIVAIQVLMFAVLVCHPFSAKSPGGKLRIDFLDVGQGDSALLTMPDGVTLLVDGGGRPQFLKNSLGRRGRSVGEMVVSEYLWYQGRSSVDYVVATHADADHIDGLNDVVKNFTVRSALVGRTPANDERFVEFSQTLEARHTPLQIVQAGDVLKLGAVEIDVLWPPASATGAPSRNNDSVVLRVRFGERTILLTGDIEKATEDLLNNVELQCDVVKVPHHGSRTSSTESFVSHVRPRLAIISVGQTSMFGHPHAEVVDRWKGIGAEVLTTGRSGMITVETDGKSLTVTEFVKR